MSATEVRVLELERTVRELRLRDSLGRARAQGYDAGYAHQDLGSNPHVGVAADAWREGWARGSSDLQRDIARAEAWDLGREVREANGCLPVEGV